MDTGKAELNRGTAVIVGTICLAIAILATSCGGTGSVSLTGTDDASAASLSPTDITIANQPVGSTSAPQYITLSNSGNAAFSITSLAFTGTNPSDFAQTNNCGSSVAAGASCTITVTFQPKATGTRTADLTLNDDFSSSRHTAKISGTGTSTTGAASLSPTSLAFSNQPVEMTSTAQTVTLTNTGTTTLSITGFAVTGANSSDFVQNNNCGSSVAAGANCTIVVLFTPSAIGARTAALSISDNASGSPQTVSLSGTGSHDVVLSWTPSPTSGVIGYDVYRGTTSGGESSTPLNSTPINGTTYTDENVTAGTKYYYQVTSVTSNGVTQSAASNETAATVPSP